MNAVDAGLAVRTADGPRLVGSRCGHCGVIEFPRRDSCPRCTRAGVADELLAHNGTLWTWTIQRFEPKAPFVSPVEFVPFGVGYIELGGQLIVQSRLTVADPDVLVIGMPMRLVISDCVESAPGEPPFAFAPEEAV